MHDVPVLHHVVLTLHGQFTRFAYGGFATIFYIVVVLDDFRTDETFLEVRMDDAGALRSLPALAVGPCLDFHLSGGDECLQVQELVDGFDEAVASAFLQAKVFQEHQEHLFFLVSFQFGNVGFRLGGDDDEFGVFPFNGLAHLFHVGNAYAAARALDANLYSSFTDGMHRVSFDKVVEVMKQTGNDLPSLYKETSEGGLAKDYKPME